MLGVILWSDPHDRKAVIWCEDQGDLAFLNEAKCDIARDGFFDAGDVVQFDLEINCSVRKAHNPMLLVERAGRSLTEALRKTPAVEMDAGSSAKIISFKSAPSVRDTKTPRVASTG